MPKTPKHTPGAMRVAATILRQFFNWPPSTAKKEQIIADLIDRETAAPELLEAIRAAQEIVGFVEAGEKRLVGRAHTVYCKFTKGHARKVGNTIRAAIAKALQGVNPDWEVVVDVNTDHTTSYIVEGADPSPAFVIPGSSPTMLLPSISLTASGPIGITGAGDHLEAVTEVAGDLQDALGEVLDNLLTAEADGSDREQLAAEFAKSMRNETDSTTIVIAVAEFVTEWEGADALYVLTEPQRARAEDALSAASKVL